MKGIVEDPGTADSADSAGFGCAVNNRFGLLLDDEGDPFAAISNAANNAKAEKKKKEVKKDEGKQHVAPAVKKESQKDRRVPVSEADTTSERNKTSLQGQRFPSRGGSGPTEDRGERRVGFRERRPYDNEASLGFSIERPAEQGERGTRGRGGGRGGDRGTRGRGGGQFRSTDGFDQRGKREFDRHSGSERTGVRPEEKRGGSGPRNWGSMRDQINDGAPGEEILDREEGAEPTEPKANQAPEGEVEPVAEPAVEMSLDEWKALQQQSRPKAEFNLRKADSAVPSDMVVHKSKKPLEEQAKEAEGEAEALRRPANDITAQLQINFGSLGRPQRGGARGGRGGRGGGRGGPAARPETATPQKSPEKPRVQACVPNHDDPEDFPALA